MFSNQQYENEVSYAAPLAKPFIGATVGDSARLRLVRRPRCIGWSGLSS
jgi:transcription elongation GreA/GreB family factor